MLINYLINQNKISGLKCNTHKSTISRGFKSFWGVGIVLLVSVLISSVKGSEHHYKSETLTNTQIISSDIKFDGIYIIKSIVKIKGKYYFGIGKSSNISIGKSKSYLDCLLSYTKNKPLTKYEVFKYITLPKLFK
ncbi:MAG: hypothetical protein H8E55_74700 [Pelagibacterales bacterium]|nr:hypothetical protein [Pelagibacterales bacterium]